MARRKAPARKEVQCYLCEHRFEVSGRAMSTTCPGCHRAIKIEDVTVKSYLPVAKLQTCGKINITKRGRVAAYDIQSGDDITCEGSMEGSVQSKGRVILGPKSTWKGKNLESPVLTIAEGAVVNGQVSINPPV